MGRPIVTSADRARLEWWLDELERWQVRVNLSTVPRHAAWVRHVEESLDLLAVARPAAGARVVDIGSGAGVPGIPIAVLRPDLEVVLLDSDTRRIGFLAHVCGLLGLERAHPLARRAESLGRQPGGREGFDLAVSRATAPAAALCELALPLLRLGGALVALVADAPAAAAAAAAAARACGGSRPEAVGPRLLRLTKPAPTPAAYPRRDGLAQRRPL